MATLNDLVNALNGDMSELSAVTTAQTAVDTAIAALADAQTILDDAIAAESTDTSVEEAAVAAAQTILDTANTNLTAATANVSNASTLDIINTVKITDFGMVSNDMARKILAAQGKTVKFEEPVDVKSDFWMNPIV